MSNDTLATDEGYLSSAGPAERPERCDFSPDEFLSARGCSKHGLDFSPDEFLSARGCSKHGLDFSPDEFLSCSNLAQNRGKLTGCHKSLLLVLQTF